MRERSERRSAAEEKERVADAQEGGRRKHCREELVVTYKEAFLAFDPLKLTTAFETLNDVGAGAVASGGENAKRNGSHGGARKRVKVAYSEAQRKEITDLTHDEDDQYICMPGSDGEDSDADDEASDDEASDDEELVPARSVIHRTALAKIGKRFKDDETDQIFQVHDVFYADEPEYKGVAVQYWRCVDSESDEVSDPGSDDSDMEWSPIGLLQGKNSWAKWF